MKKPHTTGVYLVIHLCLSIARTKHKKTMIDPMCIGFRALIIHNEPTKVHCCKKTITRVSNPCKKKNGGKVCSLHPRMPCGEEPLAKDTRGRY